jgi:preprotein translocase subunit SecF
VPAKAKSHKVAIAFGATTGFISLIFLAVGLLFWWRCRRNRKTLFNIDGK